MIFVETERLLLQALTAAQVRLYLQNDGALEKVLKIKAVPREIPAELLELLENYFLPQVNRHPTQAHFYTLWSLIAKKENQMVGDFCFKGEPSEEGQVEIGYGIFPEFRGLGLMTEAVGGILRWCQTQPNVTIVLAETEMGNRASERVLEKYSFSRYFQGPDDSWWEYTLSP